MQSLCFLLFLTFASAQMKTAFDPIGLIVVAIFYVIILIAGIFAAHIHKSTGPDDMVLAGRSLSGFTGVLTMVSTWVCGGYLYGTTQGVMTVGSGLAWTQAPWCYAVCFFFGSALFVKKMREMEYITMMDPLQKKFGNFMTGLLYLPTVFGDVFWIAMALATLGAALSAIIGISSVLAIIISAAFSALYTFIGGLYAVAFTDVIQLAMMLLCLYLAVPFVLTSSLVSNPSTTSNIWVGSIESDSAWIWIDTAVLMILGGIPWQVYFQRVLACKTVKDAQVLSIWSGVGAFVAAIPAAIVGIWGTTVDWSKTEILELTNYSYALSYILKYCTPVVVSYLALGGIAAATMSTADSALLASSTVFCYNVYRPIFRNNASEREMLWVTRIGVVVICIIGVVLAIISDDVYALWVLTSDFIYCLLFPQLLLVLYYPRINTYGSFVAFIVSAFLRLGGGEPAIGLPHLIDYGKAPFRTISMLVGIALLLAVSELSHYLIVTLNHPQWDFVHFYDQSANDAETGAAVKAKAIELPQLEKQIEAVPDTETHEDNNDKTVQQLDYSNVTSPEPINENNVIPSTEVPPIST